MSHAVAVYEEGRSWNPLAQTVELSADGLRVGGRTAALSELNLGAMAEAYLRGGWLGGGGSERELRALADGPGVVPVTRVTGTAKPVKVRQAAEFARQLGELAVERCGGPDEVAALGARARSEGVPLWIARRFAAGPLGPVAVAVDRRLVRVDVWGPGAPVVRVRAPGGLYAGDTSPGKGLVLTVGEVPAELTLTKVWRKSRSSVSARTPQGQWELQRESASTSRLLRDGHRVALLTRPGPRTRPEPGTVLLPLAGVRYDTSDPLAAVMAHTFATAFGLGDGTGTYRFQARRDASADDAFVVGPWEQPWYSNLGSGREDNEPGGGDGWGSDGGDGGDGGGGGGGDGGSGGGGDGGGGGGGGD
ncbi:hypothetical protein [Streptomyces apocyni]|uniref:hypothetical protein n=1 Tax=Streptomyces apocyni TaxID=2654677 RepID=UPI0018D13CD6|nr:hypothetical protein [Streptomyces apocyni]